jgi:hypothetical protein
MAFIGNTVQTQGFTPAIDYFNGNGVTVTFTLSRPVASVAQMVVAVDNVIQNPSSAFNVSGNSITFTSAPLSGTNNIWVEYTSLITTYQGISQDPSVIGDITATGGFLSTGDFGNSFIDGAVIDYVTGAGRITVGELDNLIFYHGGTSGRSEMMKLSYAGASTLEGALTATGAGSFQGVTVGKGGGAVASNTAFGVSAIGSSNTGNYNTAVGYQALQASTTSQNNVAVGYQAGYSTTTGTYNTFVGERSAYSLTTGSYNTAFGTEALRSATTGRNTAFGTNAGYGITTGTFNQCFGDNAGASVTTGSKNVILGCYSGNQNTLDIRTSTNTIVLSDGDGVPRSWYQSSNYIISPVSPTGAQYTFDLSQFYAYPDNTSKLGYPSYRWTVVYAVSGTINTSDANQKQQIRSLDDAEKAVARRIKGLIKAFKWNDSVAEKGDGARIHVGVIAQDVQAAFIAEGLDPSRYGMFCSDSWYAVDGDAGKASDPHTADTEGAVEVTQLGIRYDQLLSFVISAL